MRIFMGIVWFVVFFLVLYILFSIVVGVLAASGSSAVTMEQGMQAGMEFARNHAVALSIGRWTVFILSVALAVLGTWKRALPGTRAKKSAEVASE